MDEKDFDKQLGINAKRLREEAGLSQETVSKYLGLSRSTYKQYENSKRRFPAYLIVMLQDFYGVGDSLDFFEKDIFSKNKELQERLQLLKLLDIDEFEKTVIAFSDDQMAKFEYETNNNIKYNLKRLRNINNKNQQQVADKLGVNLSTYSRYESGDVIIDNNRLGELAKWYMVPITDFYKEID